MENFNYIELIGYAGSILVAISLSMKSLLKLRWINLVGSSFFAVYGYMVGATPVFVVNTYISIMNLWYILDYKRTTDKLEIDTLESVGYSFFKKFYTFYEDDIRYYFPHVNYDDLKASETSVLFRNMIPVCIFSMSVVNEGKARILMDYLVPEFRDFKFGNHIYRKKSYLFRDRQINKLEAITNIKAHQNYLKKLGFKQEAILPNGDKLFVKNIT